MAEWFNIAKNQPEYEVRTGGRASWDLQMGKSQSFITSSLYGCSVAVLMGPHGLVIGHLPEGTIQDAKMTETYIDQKLHPAALDVELTQSCDPDPPLHGLILPKKVVQDPKGLNAPGIKVLEEYMETQLIHHDNIFVYPYEDGEGSVGDPRAGGSQKFLVRWLSPSAAAGGTLEIYKTKPKPIMVVHYDAQGNEIDRKGKRFNGRQNSQPCRRPPRSQSTTPKSVAASFSSKPTALISTKTEKM